MYEKWIETYSIKLSALRTVWDDKNYRRAPVRVRNDFELLARRLFQLKTAKKVTKTVRVRNDVKSGTRENGRSLRHDEAAGTHRH